MAQSSREIYWSADPRRLPPLGTDPRPVLLSSDASPSIPSAPGSIASDPDSQPGDLAHRRTSHRPPLPPVAIRPPSCRSMSVPSPWRPPSILTSARPRPPSNWSSATAATLRVPAGFDPATLHQLLDVLEERS